MHEHLNNDGRAGIVVPEGIIFQSGSTYKDLRRNLLNDSLYAVVSLPAGVFNPYSGVKTSILFLDKKIAKKSKEVLFVKVEADGYNLGAQRREIKENDLPLALEVLKEFQNSVLEGVEPKLEKFERVIAHIVHKDKISEQDYNLSGDRYKEAVVYDGNWDLVELGEVINLDFGVRITKNKDQGTKYPVYGGGGQSFFTDSFNRENEYVISRFAMSENCVRFVSGQFFMMDSGFTFSIKDDVQGKLNKDYVGKILMSIQDRIYSCGRGHAQKNLDVKRFKSLEIPLPPLEIQERVVEEIESYQNIIDGAKKVVESYKPSFKIDPEWDVVELGEACDVRDGTHDSPQYVHEGYPLVTSKNVKDGTIDFTNVSYVSKEDFDNINKRSLVEDGDIIMPMIGTIGSPIVVKKDREFAIKNVALIKFKDNLSANNYFINYVLSSELFESYIPSLTVC